MNVRSNSVGNHLVDIHEVLHEEEEDKEENRNNIPNMADKADTRFNRPTKNKNERKVLERSGKCFGGFGVNGTTEAGRYFDVLRGPELDQVKDSPFLLRFLIGCFGIFLGLSSQAILWRSLALSPVTKFLHVPFFINLAIWLSAVGVLVVAFTTYMFKCAPYFEAIKREYFHRVRVNLFCAPWIVCMFLAIGAPPKTIPGTLHPAIWCVFMAPIFFLNLNIYGQWLLGGKRRLCKVANPSSHLSVIGNFVGPILAAKFLWSIGFTHYLVVFVTLYQRSPTSEAVPKELMFIDEFDGLAKTCYVISLFLYLSLVWSYVFLITTVSIATIKYAEEVPPFLTKALALALSFMSTTMVCILFVSTLLHAFVWKTLFPNDLSIAVTKKRYSKDKKPLIKRW
ncbi:unnamed protein product [Withania somnifera]